VSAGGESLFIYIGVSLTVSSLVAIVRPDLLVRESRRNWEARLRELEAYPPRFDVSHAQFRRFGFVGLLIAVTALAVGLT
jgi:hypothetical protein